MRRCASAGRSVGEPVRILSDLHLGHKVSRIERVSALRPLIAGAATVIFNGDTWQELARPFYDRSLAMLEELKALCREEGAEAVFLPGNHDPGWPGQGWAELAEGKILVTHGDALLFDGSPWKREILTHGPHVRKLWSEHPAADTDAGERLAIARKVARDLCSVEYPTGRSFIERSIDAVLPPHRAWKMLESWRIQGSEGAAFCDRYFPKVEVLLIGHFHHAGSWLRGGRRIINTGSFMAPGRAHWAEWHDGWLRYGKIQESPTECHKLTADAVWRV
jgi:predicted phosphodiesterase